ncbi:MAG: multiheme c-type cytochrome, partial [Myxococcota bacterium]
MVRRFARIACVLLALVLACDRASDRTPAPAASEPAPAPLEFVGSARCAGCHASETQRWHGSQHDQAMQEANAETVLGDFGSTRFEHFGSTSTFFRRDERYFVNTEGPDAARADFEIEYTFGVAPLQQYLVRLPGGRLQALNTAYDTRPRAAGGQRWFHLYPDEAVPAGDVLHWTKPSQNWNAQCAECHSTNLRKGFDLAKDSYATSWSDLDVGCESCHGPGSRHVAWADAAARGDAPDEHDLGLTLRFRESSPARWVFAEGASIAHREPPLATQRELETCAPCHARRSTLREGRRAGEPLLDTHRPALLGPGLYEADGQMRDEVYVYGSFVQSRMYTAGVTCSDCHEPHSLALRAEGNALCAQCHRPEVFDAPAHHHHAAGSAGAQCIACHLPARTYMGIDVRHDHSFRVPRPDLSVSIGTPNACNDCHTHRSPRWAADAAKRWFPSGRSGTPHYGVALDAGRRGLPGAEPALAGVAEDPAQPG